MNKETIKINKLNTLMIAHRGISALAKENSIEAFVLAGKSTHYGIETDVHVTKDNKYIVHHDDNIKRCTGVDLIIEENNFDDIRKIPLLGMDNEETIDKQYSPTLEEYLTICKTYNKRPILELKAKMTEDNVLNIAKIVEQFGLIDNITFISFHPNNLIYLRNKYKDVDIQFLVGEKPWYLRHVMFILLKKYRFGLDIDYHFVTERLIKKVHKYGLKINTWTVDDKLVAEQFAKWGIDQITSNGLE